MEHIWKFILIWYPIIINNTVFGRGFTIVLDTTVSMKEEIDIIKANIGSVVNVNNWDDINNYIIVPFSDTDVGTVISHTKKGEFIDSFSSIRTGGGEECPENSLAGIQTALEISEPLSYIFVFTDAFAKSYSNVSTIINLCKHKQSQVNVFLSGYCLPSEKNWEQDMNVYYEVTKSCSGVVFHFDLYNLRQAFRYMKEIMKTEWSGIKGFESFRGFKQIPLPVHEYVKEMVVVASSEAPLPTMDVVDMNGLKRALDHVVDDRNTQVLRFLNPDTGTYTLNIRSGGITSVAVFVRYQLAFQYGFSTASPFNLLETTEKPIPGRPNYILIQPQSTLSLQSVEIYTLGRETATILEIEEITPGIHITRVYIEANQLIKIYVKLQDPKSFLEISSATDYFSPQKTVTNNIPPQEPKVEIINMEKNIVDYKSDVRIASKVTGYPKPNIHWEDSTGAELLAEDSLLEIPYTYISYASIKNIVTNMTIQCKADNSEGDSSQTFDLYVNRTYSFEVLRTPADTSIEFETEGKLYCEVDAYPEASIHWYHNDSLITDTDNTKWVPDENALIIKNMSILDPGEYKCEVKNDVETKVFTAQVDITGLETPKVDLEKRELVLTSGESVEIECRVIKGKPLPIVTWLYKSENSYDFDYIPTGVSSDDGKLKIESAQLKHEGLYRCEASNFIGEDFRELAIKVEFPPIISNNEETTMVVKEGDPVEMTCDVTASPKVTVRWEMSQDDIIVLDERHTTDDRYTHRFNALWRDSGKYHCIAENKIGRADKSVILIVLVAPYIETPATKNLTARIGDEVMLLCNVLFGNPVPAVKWEFISTDSTAVVLKRDKSTNTLHLMNVTQANEGTYLCVAENSVGIDRIKYHLQLR